MSKKYVVGLLVLFAVIATSATFAFWASGITGADNTETISVAIGEGDEVTTTVTLTVTDDERTLVPSGYEDNDNTFDTNVFTFVVEWDGTGAEGATGTLTVTIEDLTLGTLLDAEIEGMFTITINPDDTAITAGTPLTVTVTVLFANEPVDQAMYTEVANGSLSLDIKFNVVAD